MSRKESKRPTDRPIARGDLENQLRTLKGDVDTVKDSTVGAGVAIIGGIALLIIILAFLMGRNRGKQKFSFVEVRRG